MKNSRLIILALVAMVGLVVRSLDAGVICIDEVGYCNDVKIFISPDTAGSIKEIHGYEYGCGYYDRGISGSMEVTSTSKHFTLLGSYSGSLVKVLYIHINKATNTGTGNWNYIGRTSGTADFGIVPCPPTLTPPSGISEPDDTD
jgi:hypothetical protein